MVKKLTWGNLEETPDQAMNRELWEASPDGQAEAVVREAIGAAMLAAMMLSPLPDARIHVRLWTEGETDGR